MRDRLSGASFRLRAALVALVTANVVLVAITLYGFLVPGAGYDWSNYVEAGRRVLTGDLFRWEGIYAWIYSPLLAYLFVILAPIGFVGWSLLHVAAVGALRDRRLALITVASWPFWADVYNGNTMVFVFVAAAAAMRRSPVGTASYLLLSLLMPRPVMLPVLAWILWTQPQWRLRFSVMVVIYALGVLATGEAMSWLHALWPVRSAVADPARDIGPDLLIGSWWLLLGAPLAIWLTVRGRPGLASLAASPYWLPQYLLMALLELVPKAHTQSGKLLSGRSGQQPSPPTGRH